jgi:hypothetical protein
VPAAKAERAIAAKLKSRNVLVFMVRSFLVGYDPKNGPPEEAVDPDSVTACKPRFRGYRYRIRAPRTDELPTGVRFRRNQSGYEELLRVWKLRKADEAARRRYRQW